MAKKTKVYLTIECRNMKNPKQQRSRFDQTLGAASWMLQENKRPEIHNDGTVTTASVWGRVFGGRKTTADIEQRVENLLKRATEYAEIEDYKSDLEFMDIKSGKDEFSHPPVLFSED